MDITSETAIGLFVLATNHYHDWSKMTDPLTIATDGWEKMVLDVTEAMDAYDAERIANNSPGMPCGLPPATSHTTGTGRLSWSVGYKKWATFSYGNQEIHLEVTRPAPGLSGSSSVVMRMAVRADLYTDLLISCDDRRYPLPPHYMDWEILEVELEPAMVKLRHVQAVATALYGDCAPPQVRGLLGVIDAPSEWALGIEAEIVAEEAMKANHLV